ncbi:DUF177 domain-containing protein [candidate division KSB1 bacterium]|nr:DUF177 domain-containing protein [candidate division KSB1 bacterium]
MKIKITNIPEGISDFDFAVSIKELVLENSTVFSEPVAVHLEIQKFASNYLFTIQAKYKGHFTCDRCLSEFVKEIEASTRITYTADETLFVENSDDIRLLHPHQVILNLVPELREMLLLSLPVKVLCSKGCQGICPNCGANLNHETCQCQKTTYDSRWDALKSLIDQEEK